jgi:hypothetical protein
LIKGFFPVSFFAASLRDLSAVSHLVRPFLPWPPSVHKVLPLSLEQSIHNQGAKKKPEEQEQTEKNKEGNHFRVLLVLTSACAFIPALPDAQHRTSVSPVSALLRGLRFKGRHAVRTEISTVCSHRPPVDSTLVHRVGAPWRQPDEPGAIPLWIFPTYSTDLERQCSIRAIW